MLDIAMAPRNSVSATETKKFLRAAHGETLDTQPVWVMREAGRYVPEYWAVRANNDVMKVGRTHGVG